jgi:TerC family integral membrane protein
MFRGGDDNFEPHESFVVKLAMKHTKISRHYDKDKFFTVENGVRTGTMLLLVLIVVEFTDLVFAVDSIPAIFGITTDRFIVYTSNIFAILGLRTFYFMLASLADRFHLLRYGLAFILTFIGIKMLLPLLAGGLIMVTGENNGSSFAVFLRRFLNHEFEQVTINISLGVVVLAITVSIIASLMIKPKTRKEDLIEEVAEAPLPRP